MPSRKERPELQHVAYSLSIACPPEAVFKHLTPDKMGPWVNQEALAVYQGATSLTPGKGVRYSLVQRIGPSDMPVEMEIIEYEPPRLCRSKAWNDYFDGVLSFLLTPDPPGTRLSVTEQFTAKGVLGKLMESYLGRQLQLSTERSLHRLKQMVEAG